MIENAEANTIIHLPAKTIRLPKLELRVPLIIKGKPGTVLEL